MTYFSMTYDIETSLPDIRVLTGYPVLNGALLMCPYPTSDQYILSLK